MKKFLAFAAAGVLVLSMAGCNKDKEPAPTEPATVTEGEAEGETEPETETEPAEEPEEEPVEEPAEEDETFFGLAYETPEGWQSGKSDRYVWFAPEGSGNTVFLVVFDGDPGEDFSIMGTGKHTTQVEGTEPIVIEPFEAGNFTWHGYSINHPAYFGPETIVLLASDADSETGKVVGAQILLGLDEEPDVSLDDADIQSILAGARFIN